MSEDTNPEGSAGAREEIDVNSLKSKLDSLNEQKEQWFTKKEELKKKIADLIRQVREVKAKNDSFAQAIKELKEKRDAQNLEVRKLIEQIKGLTQDKIIPLDKDPVKLKARIDALEARIETGGVSFDEEKKLMKQIKDLKKDYESGKAAVTARKESSDLSKKIDEAKKIAKEFHDKITETAKNYKEGYKEFMTLSKEINRIKKEQEEAFEKFISFKQQFAEANQLLKQQIEVVNVQKQERRKRKERVVKERRVIEDKKLEERKEQVEEKIKKKKILTTEDLIAFQGKEAEE